MTRDEIAIGIEALRQQLVAKYAPDKIILFGSCVRQYKRGPLEVITAM